jgi:hypothetical protein
MYYIALWKTLVVAVTIFLQFCSKLYHVQYR